MSKYNYIYTNNYFSKKEDVFIETLKEYHHFREDLSASFDRVAKYERNVVNCLLTSKILDSEMESSICWELKHQASTIQFARILALKRGLVIDVCAVGLLLHDIASIHYGKYKDHAQRGASLAKDILSNIGGFSEEEEIQILKIIQNHSDKHIWTNDPYQEIGKDVDVLDCFLYKGAFDFYLGYKSLPVFKGYLDRAKKTWAELGLPPDIRFTILDGYSNQWFQHLRKIPIEIMIQILAVLFELTDKDKTIGVCPPPFFIVIEGNDLDFYANSNQWNRYINDLSTKPNLLMPTQKYETISSLFMNTFTNKFSNESFANMNFNKDFVHEKYLYKISNILKEDDLERRGVIFWPLVDIFESLCGDRLSMKLKEVGVIL